MYRLSQLALSPSPRTPPILCTACVGIKHSKYSPHILRVAVIPPPCYHPPPPPRLLPGRVKHVPVIAACLLPLPYNSPIYVLPGWVSNIASIPNSSTGRIRHRCYPPKTRTQPRRKVKQNFKKKHVLLSLAFSTCPHTTGRHLK